MSIVFVNASPFRHSRTAALLHALGCKLDRLDWDGKVHLLRIADLSARSLLVASTLDADIQHVLPGVYAVATHITLPTSQGATANAVLDDGLDACLDECAATLLSEMRLRTSLHYFPVTAAASQRCST